MKNKIIFKEQFLKSDKNIKFALDYIKNTDFSKFANGRINLTDTIWANLQTYTTKEDALFEAHRKYIDIQFIIKGNEYIGVSEYSKSTNKTPYDKEKDIEFLESTGENIKMQKGDFLILYPDDAHKPSITIKEPVEVRKLVIKVPVEK